MADAPCFVPVPREELRAGSLALARMRAVDEGQLIDERLAELERRLGIAAPRKPNGRMTDPEYWSVDAS
jgi:hypothetical protein